MNLYSPPGGPVSTTKRASERGGGDLWFILTFTLNPLWNCKVELMQEVTRGDTRLSRPLRAISSTNHSVFFLSSSNVFYIRHTRTYRRIRTASHNSYNIRWKEVMRLNAMLMLCLCERGNGELHTLAFSLYRATIYIYIYLTTSI